VLQGTRRARDAGEPLRICETEAEPCHHMSAWRAERRWTRSGTAARYLKAPTAVNVWSPWHFGLPHQMPKIYAPECGLPSSLRAPFRPTLQRSEQNGRLGSKLASGLDFRGD